MKATVDVVALFQALDRKRVDDGLSWRGLADHLEMSSSLFTLMGQGHKPSLDGFCTIMLYLGEDPAFYMVEKI